MVKGVDLLIVGTSCKDLSRANSSAGAAGPAFSHETTRGGSAQTFKGLVAYIRVHRPLLVIYENVDALDDNAADGALNNMDILCAEMSALGYDMQKLLTDAASFGLPQRRLGSGLGWVGEACGDGSERTGRGGGRGQRAGRVAPAWRCPGPRGPRGVTSGGGATTSSSCRSCQTRPSSWLAGQWTACSGPCGTWSLCANGGRPACPRCCCRATTRLS